LLRPHDFFKPVNHDEKDWLAG